MPLISADHLVKLAAVKLRRLIRANSRASLDAFVLVGGKHHFAVRVAQVAQRPTPVFHLTVFDADGGFKVSAMLTEGMIDSISDAAVKGRTTKASAAAVPG